MSAMDILGGGDPNPAPDGSPSPSPVAAAPSAPAAPAVQTPADPSAAINTAHDTLLGRTFKALSGHGGYDYQVNPETGQMQATPRPSKGFPWAGLIAGALMGADAASRVPHTEDGSPNVVGSVGAGGASVIQDQRKQDDIARARAQQDFGTQLEAQKNQREGQEFQTRQQLQKAQLALYNIQTIKENQLVQGTNFDQHEKVAASGNAKLSPYIAAGVPLAYKDIPESQMHDLISQNPDAQNFDWEPTGTKITVDDKGQPQYESTYSAAKPDAKVTVTPDFLKLVKDSGMMQYYPSLKDVLKDGMQLDVSQFLAIKHNLTDLQNTKLGQQKEQASIGELQARTHEANAQAAKATAEIKQIGADKKQAELFRDALGDLDKAGGDFSQVKPSSRVLIAESVSKLIPAYNVAIKNAVDSGDEGTAKELMSKRDNLLTLSSNAFSNKPAAEANIPAGAQTATNPQTGEKVWSTDGGKTWNKAGAQPAAAPAPTAEEPVNPFAPVANAVKRGVNAIAGSRFRESATPK